MTERLEIFRFRGEPPTRLDKYLVNCLPEFSRARLQNLIKDGLVRINGVPAEKSGQLLDRPAEVVVYIPPALPTELKPEAIPLDIIFENDDLIVINKPAGMVVHPSAGHTSGTLVHAVLSHAPGLEGIGGEQRPGIVHRLDKETSGLILVAKNERAQRWLQDQFRLRKVTKIYLALVDGKPPTPTGRVEAPIGRDTSQRKLMAVVSPTKGRDAISEYFSLENFVAHTLLEVHPITGRTHQIRLHMAFLGCPVVGDTVYGRRTPTLALDRHFLHAQRLVVRLPNEKTPRTFIAPLPIELENILAQLKG